MKKDSKFSAKGNPTEPIITTSSSSVSETIRNELQAMVDEDNKVREKLVNDGTLSDRYSEEMETVHVKNGGRLEKIIEQYGWPNMTLVGADGERNAWLIIQHAISIPSLQRKCLSLLNDEAKKGEAPLEQVAMLEDRIRIFEGKKQLYGTQFDWDENNLLSPLPIEDPVNVDTLRKQMNLPPLEERVLEVRERIKRNHEKPPKDKIQKQKAFEQWITKVGWRNS